MNNQNFCPHCKAFFDKLPQRKTKCPSCKKDVYVRTKQELFPRILLSKDDAISVDWFQNLELQYGVSKQNFFIERERLLKNFGKDPNATDIIWGLFNQLIKSTNDLSELSNIYYLMALFLNEENRNFFDYLQLSRKMELMNLKKSEVIKVEIFDSGDSACESCKRLNGTILTIDDALEKMPIPNKDCKNKLKNGKEGFCMCCYVSVVI